MKTQRQSSLLFLLLLIGFAAILLWISEWREAPLHLVSGTIETGEIIMKFEVNGQVTEVFVTEGEIVKAGDVLLKLDDTLFQAEYHQAEIELSQAKAEYDLLNSQPLQEQRIAAIADAEVEVLETRQKLQAIIRDAEMVRAQAQKHLEENELALEDLLDPSYLQSRAKVKIAEAEKAQDSAKRKLSIINTPPTQAVIDQAQANLLLAESVLSQTLEDLQWAREKLHGNLGPEVPKEYYIDQYKAEFRQIVQAFETKLSQDQLAYNDALAKYVALLKPPDPVEVALAEAALAVAEAQLKQAQREFMRVAEGPSKADISVLEARIKSAKIDYKVVKDGPNPEDLALGEAQVRQAEAKLELALANTIDEELAVARAQLTTAQATLTILQARLDQLVMTAPIDGIIVDRTIEAGEVVSPGSRAFLLMPSNQLTIKFYLPEEKYDQVRLGAEYPIQVDAFPVLTLKAQVIKIADQESFLPRNETSRRQLSQSVFAVRMVLMNPPGTIKPGMQAHLDTGSIERLNE